MEMIDVIVARGFVGYFVDEPTRRQRVLLALLARQPTTPEMAPP